MKIKEVEAEIILDSRKEKTIKIGVNSCFSSAPSGKSKGKYEKPSYIGDINHDVSFINKLKLEELPEINEFSDLGKIEELFMNKIGANTLFAFESSILKVLAYEKNKELWQVLNPILEKNIKDAKFPSLLSNTIGGGAHSHGKIKPDFQEFLFSCEKNPLLGEKINQRCHEEAEIIINNLRLHTPNKNDENAWECDLDNEQVLEVMKEIQEDVFEETSVNVNMGLDVAGSQFYEDSQYIYKNREYTNSRQEQIDYISELIKRFNLFYVEDALDEEDFEGFAELLKKTEGKTLIVGDDLTVTNLERVRKAIGMKAISGLIVKPNQTGSLIEVKKIVDLCKNENIKIIVSHRSGETLDSTIADIAFAFQADYIKIPVVGEERLAKVKRLKEIEASLK